MPAAALTTISRALISVSDKRGLAELGRFLAECGVGILSTGGSARTLSEAGIAVTEVAAHTGFPEILDGRVKTLHPKIHGGILARRDHPDDRAALSAHDIAPIDLVVVNLYPFEETLAAGADPATLVETIDIGGPAMLRAAAKNHDYVTVVTDPDDYAAVMAEMRHHKGATGSELRRRLAARAFAHSAAYDAAVSGWMLAREGETFPPRIAAGGRLRQALRYGENPHQTAAFYAGGATRLGIADAAQIQGKELSYNNLNDSDAAFELVAEFTGPDLDRPAVAIVKHANPCGVALGDTLLEAWRRAFACDPVSAYGGIVALNRPLDETAAAAIGEIFVEVVIAPGAEAGARKLFAAKPNLRLLVTGGLPDPAAPGMTLKTLSGGYLLQSRDNGRIARNQLEVVTKRPPSERELVDLLFAFRVAKHVKSNAIVYAKGGATVGIGAGQMSRVDSARIAAWKAREALEAARQAGRSTADLGSAGSVVASDAFFPFADGLVAAVEAGATAVIQPGGSLRDKEVIAAADEAGIAMVFTGQRHFRH
ncbi:MAG TPA: bifunctional phosphoribosylaminoimidazolecarboxamide formyltransferase/IMP cyclohydrolase [Kiloniellales bacterium]|nr:bifunctional phosphoribosylaminoimidazolecarboxamide formyltransferase/IMP cyclohydrolase [Kiloniellales bacterium]